MSDATSAGEAAPAELLQAFKDLRPHLFDVSMQTSRMTPESNPDDYSREDIEQFLNAYEALMLEALEGRGRAKRDIIFESALPAVVAEGQPAVSMIQSNVATSVMMTYRLLDAVPAAAREESALWLAGFFSGYTREMAERTLELERDGRA
jgi:hypothetical protein